MQMSTKSATDAACVSSQWNWRLSFVATLERTAFYKSGTLFFSLKYVTVLINCLEKKVLTSTFLRNMWDEGMHAYIVVAFNTIKCTCPLHLIQLITHFVKSTCSSAHIREMFHVRGILDKYRYWNFHIWLQSCVCILKLHVITNL